MPHKTNPAQPEKLVDIRAYRQALQELTDDTGLSAVTIIQAGIEIGLSRPDELLTTAQRIHARKTDAARLSMAEARKKRKTK